MIQEPSTEWSMPKHSYSKDPNRRCIVCGKVDRNSYVSKTYIKSKDSFLFDGRCEEHLLTWSMKRQPYFFKTKREWRSALRKLRRKNRG